jgi:hypothetical protein
MGGAEWLDLTKTFGLPIVGLTFILWALGKRLWAPGWVVVDLTAQLHTAQQKIAELEGKLERRNEIAWRLVETNSKAVGALADVAASSNTRGEP